MYNKQVVTGDNKNGGIAQLARALGSYPGCHRFKSSYRHHLSPVKIWPVGQEVKTTPFHGVIMGSIPVRVIPTESFKTAQIRCFEAFLFLSLSQKPLIYLLLLKTILKVRIELKS